MVVIALVLGLGLRLLTRQMVTKKALRPLREVLEGEAKWKLAPDLRAFLTAFHERARFLRGLFWA